MENTVFIISKTTGKTVEFAAEELKRYLCLAGISAHCAERAVPEEYLKTISLEITDEVEGIEDTCLDDGYVIEISDLRGSIKGTNERSILLGCYRFLKEIGFAFLRPDPQGERVPENIEAHVIDIKEKAAYRYRGMCIEGAVSFENIIQFIQWLPKNGFNTYFTQFLTPYEFFKTWYAHTNNPLYKTGSVPTPAQVEGFTDHMIVPELKKRGMLWQAAGHGFNTETIGIRGLGWDKIKEEEMMKSEWMAQIDGERKLFQGVPMNTNLCYSDETVCEEFAGKVMEYLESHKGIDILHIWLADGGNNSCECENCRKKRPSDWYINLLNIIDQKLTQKKINVKIVFLAYFDLLWPPVENRLLNKDRFIFMFAPITRSYREPLPLFDEKDIPEFKRNKLIFPKSAEENIRYAQAWKRYFDGDSFIYDYHYMWNQFRDWGDYESARILFEDIKRLEKNDFRGYISCQQTRTFAPTGLGMYVLGKCLWGCNETFQELTEEYFSLLYGQYAEEILNYVTKISDIGYATQPEDMEIEDMSAAEYMKEAVKYAEEYIPVFEDLLNKPDDKDKKKWIYLFNSAETAKRYFLMMEYKRMGKKDEAKETYLELKKFLCEKEDEWQEGFDVYWFIKTYDPLF